MLIKNRLSSVQWNVVNYHRMTGNHQRKINGKTVNTGTILIVNKKTAKYNKKNNTSRSLKAETKKSPILVTSNTFHAIKKFRAVLHAYNKRRRNASYFKLLVETTSSSRKSWHWKTIQNIYKKTRRFMALNTLSWPLNQMPLINQNRLFFILIFLKEWLPHPNPFHCSSHNTEACTVITVTP